MKKENTTPEVVEKAETKTVAQPKTKNNHLNLLTNLISLQERLHLYL